MLPKQTDYKVGIYLRLSRDDERQGESLSIENQRRVLTNYVKEQSWTGVSKQGYYKKSTRPRGNSRFGKRSLKLKTAKWKRL